MNDLLVGQRIERKEDLRFLTGAGQYTDDVTLPSAFECDTGEDLGGSVVGAYYGSQQEEHGLGFAEGLAVSLEAR